MPELTEEQRQAMASIDANILVSAGAGSGKTMVLVERYLEVLRNDPESTINDIVAVTFTRKAAEEMRARIKARLREMVATAEGTDAERWRKVLSEVDRARIGTIHSLCESILKSFPAEAKVDPQFEILDDLTRFQIIQSSVENALQQLISDEGTDAAALLEHPIENIRGWIQNQLKNISQYKTARALLGDSNIQMTDHANLVIFRVLENALRDFCADEALRCSLQFLQNNPWPDRENKLELTRVDIVTPLSRLIDQWSQVAKNQMKPEHVEELFALIRTISEVPSPRTNGGKDGKPLRDVISYIRKNAIEFVDKHVDSLNESDEQAFAVLRAFSRTVDQSIEYYEGEKLKLQRLDYNDLISKSHDLLCSAESTARKHFAARLKAVLVDEFQDTNRTQAALLSSLCGPDSRLFLIGDDKQSIYKFQGADVSTFNEWKHKIDKGSHGLAGNSMLLNLSYSFRSHPSIVDFVNQFFKVHFQSDSGVPGSSHRAQHRSLVPSRTDEHQCRRVETVDFDAVREDGSRQTEFTRAIEAKAIASWILEKLAEGTEILDKELQSVRKMSFGDFAVLVQTNSDFGPIERVLAEADVPYVTYAGSGFLNRQEILDIENMLRWLSCQQDSHALFAVLRSPFFGLNDGVLHKLGTAVQATLWQSIQWAAKQSEFETLIPVVASLKYLLSLTDHISVADIIRLTIQATGYDVISLSLPNGKQKSRNVWKFISFATDYSHMRMSEFLETLSAMRDLGVTGQTDAPLNAEDSVKLMTIHKSKGLEFPAVILPVLAKKVHLQTPKLLVHPEFGIAFDPTREKDEAKPAFFKASLTINNHLDAEEKKRLLYVAMTRARDFLVMFMDNGARNDTSFRSWVNEALGRNLVVDETFAAPRRANLVADQHYATRFVDEGAINEWLEKNKEITVSLLQRADIQTLSNDIKFDLILPLQFDAAGELAAKRTGWQRAERVTFTPKHTALPPTILGNLFHLIMQHAMNSEGPITRELIENLASSREVNIVEDEFRQRLIEKTTTLVSLYESSTLYEIVATATRILSEIDYTVFHDHDSTDRRPDLILQDNQGRWHIVDFKTDHLTPDEVAAKVNEHSAQVMQYAKDFSNLVGHKADCWLYFAELGLLEKAHENTYRISHSGQLHLPLPGH